MVFDAIENFQEETKCSIGDKSTNSSYLSPIEFLCCTDFNIVKPTVDSTNSFLVPRSRYHIVVEAKYENQSEDEISIADRNMTLKILSLVEFLYWIDFHMIIIRVNVTRKILHHCK